MFKKLPNFQSIYIMFYIAVFETSKSYTSLAPLEIIKHFNFSSSSSYFIVILISLMNNIIEYFSFVYLAYINIYICIYIYVFMDEVSSNLFVLVNCVVWFGDFFTYFTCKSFIRDLFCKFLSVAYFLLI
jgi:hypothetical protein